MPFLSRQSPYDVCIIGSGAGGGMTAYMLTKAGANVVVLEAGPLWYSTEDSKMFTWPYQTQRRGASTKEREFGEFDGGLGGFHLEGEPYTTAPGERFDWFRVRMLGGRTNHWGRISLRFGPYDFHRKSLDGLGDDWPITYEDVKPYYDRVDQLIGLYGSNENLPNEPNGIFMPPPKPRCYELMVKKAADKLRVTCIPARLSIITRPLNGRPACHYCGQCGRGCKTNSNFSSPAVLLRPALQTGKLTIIPQAMAREILLDSTGRASGVSYIDKTTGQEMQVRAKVVVLAASALESARLLLNSKSASFSNGLANTSGTVGKYITDTTGSDLAGIIPSLQDGIPHNEDGVGGMHLYMPWWLDNKTLDFPRGYHIEVWGGRGMPEMGFMGGIQNYQGGGGYGPALKQLYRKHYGTVIGFSGRGEMIPNENSYCEIDPTVVDRWGIPVLRFRWKWSDHEIKQVKHMQDTFEALIHEMGGTLLWNKGTASNDYGIAPGGRIIHELGAVRMGSDPKTSVLNPNCQSWDVKNLFCTDGGPFVSQADKNPTWTILALAMRTSEYIADQMKKGAL